MATLHAGGPERLVTELGERYTLSRKGTLLDLVGLGSRAPAQYDVLSGGALAGFVHEDGNAASAMLLGGERELNWVVSDAESKVLQIRKGVFASVLEIQNGAAESVGRVRRSRLPFVRSLVIERDAQRPCV